MKQNEKFLTPNPNRDMWNVDAADREKILDAKLQINVHFFFFSQFDLSFWDMKQNKKFLTPNPNRDMWVQHMGKRFWMQRCRWLSASALTTSASLPCIMMIGLCLCDKNVILIFLSPSSLLIELVSV